MTIPFIFEIIHLICIIIITVYVFYKAGINKSLKLSNVMVSLLVIIAVIINLACSLTLWSAYMAEHPNLFPFFY